MESWEDLYKYEADDFTTWAILKSGYIYIFGLRGRAFLRVAASTVACIVEGECAFPVTLSMLGIAVEIVRLWVPFSLFPPVP